MCFGCSLNGRVGWSVLITFVLTALTVIVGVLWPIYSTNLMESQLQLTEYSKSYKTWIRRPFPLIMQFYMYNCTNIENYMDWKTEKANFVERGPYTFMENVQRNDVRYTDMQKIVSYNQTKTWIFRPDLSIGSSDDLIYNINPVAAMISYMAQRFPSDPIVESIFDGVFLEASTFFVGKTVNEWIFEGFDEPILVILKQFKEAGLIPPELNIDVPYERFAWFYERNGSSSYDGRFEMKTGKGDFNKAGQLNSWNRLTNMPGLSGDCAKVQGTTGEFGSPPKKDQDVTLFLSDLCRSLTFKREGTLEKHDLEAYRWIGDARVFDNGDNYPEAKCWCSSPAQCPKHGVYDASHCKNGLPVYFSFPHFYLADESYAEAVRGISPNKSAHESHLAAEPTTGITMEVRMKLQVNFFMRHDERLRYFKEVSDLLVPMFWFTQRMDLPAQIADDVKTVLLLFDVGWWIVYALIGVVVVSAAITGYFIYAKFKMSNPQNSSK